MVDIILIDVPYTYTERFHQQKFYHPKLLLLLLPKKKAAKLYSV